MHIPNDEYENFVIAGMEAEAECIPTKLREKLRVPQESQVVRKKRNNLKIASLLYKRNPTNANAQKFKKAQRELIHTKKKNKNTFKVRSIKLETRIAWQTINEVSKRKSTSRAKLTVASQEERI